MLKLLITHTQKKFGISQPHICADLSLRYYGTMPESASGTISKVIGSGPMISPSASTHGWCAEFALMYLPLKSETPATSGLPRMHAPRARKHPKLFASGGGV